VQCRKAGFESGTDGSRQHTIPNQQQPKSIYRFWPKKVYCMGTINGITGLTVPLCVVFATCCCRERPTAWQSSLRATHRPQDGHDKFKCASPALFLGGSAPCTGSNVTNDVSDHGNCRCLQGLRRPLAFHALPSISTLHCSRKQRVWQWQRR